MATVVEAIRVVAHGETYLRRERREQLIHELTGASEDNGPTPKDLSDRELSVFLMIGTRTTTDKIAERLHLPRSTVEAHRHRIRAKLGWKADHELARRATGWRSKQ